jgi:uncharacterized protein (DUF1501 family)
MKQGMSRRRVLEVGAGAAAALAARIGNAAPEARAHVPPSHVVFVTLHGGADALSLIVPYADDAYYRARPLTAIAPPHTRGAEAAIPLDARFALHPALASLKSWFEAGELGVVLGVGTPERIRSHRRAQSVLAAAIRRAAGDENLAPLTGDEAENLRHVAGELQRLQRPAASEAPSVQTSWLELHGWDTHMAQGNDSHGRFGGLARGLAAILGTLRDAAGSAWPHTRLVVATEFGRSLGESPLRGTDDGHASALLLLGGIGHGPARGRVLGTHAALEPTLACPPHALAPSVDLETILMQSVHGELPEL